jgi:hypothetical protein
VIGRGRPDPTSTSAMPSARPRSATSGSRRTASGSNALSVPESGLTRTSNASVASIKRPCAVEVRRAVAKVPRTTPPPSPSRMLIPRRPRHVRRPTARARQPVPPALDPMRQVCTNAGRRRQGISHRASVVLAPPRASAPRLGITDARPRAHSVGNPILHPIAGRGSSETETKYLLMSLSETARDRRDLPRPDS